MRVLWAAEELGLTYEHIPLAFDDPVLKQPTFLRINPGGTIPTVVDDGFSLSESLAINLYLATKYGSGGSMPLFPPSLETQAQIFRWSLWAQGHIEPWMQRDLIPKSLRSSIDDHLQAMVQPALCLLDNALTGRSWLMGAHFTVGDLNVAAVLSPSRAAKLDLKPYGHLGHWLARCYARPAAVDVRRRFEC